MSTNVKVEPNTGSEVRTLQVDEVDIISGGLTVPEWGGITYWASPARYVGSGWWEVLTSTDVPGAHA
jgi:hypothetical protein